MINSANNNAIFSEVKHIGCIILFKGQGSTLDVKRCIN